LPVFRIDFLRTISPPIRLLMLRRQLETLMRNTDALGSPPPLVSTFACLPRALHEKRLS
jgi:hypothetical protein